MAIDILVRPESRRLIAATLGDQELIEGLKNKTYLASLKRTDPHSVLQNKFYWKVLDEVIQHQDFYTNRTELHVALKTKLGYYSEIRMIDGRVVVRVSSTAFDAMEVDERHAYVNAALAVLCQEVIPGTHQSDLLRRVEETTGLSYNALWQGAKAA